MAEVQLNVPSQFAKITKKKITQNKFNLVSGLIILHYVYVVLLMKYILKINYTI